MVRKFPAAGTTPNFSRDVALVRGSKLLTDLLLTEVEMAILHPVRRVGFTLIELLVVIAIIAVLVALLLPAVQQAREAARRSQCRNHLKQIGLALANYHENYTCYPPGYVSNRPAVTGSTTWCTSNVGGSAQHAPWHVMILPFMEFESLYLQFNFNVPFQATSNQMAAPNDAVIKHIPAYQCPSDRDLGNQPLWTSYVGVQGGGANPECSSTGCSPAGQRAFWSNGILFGGSRIRNRDITDGASNVFIVGESRYTGAAWGASAKQDGCGYVRNMAGTCDQINLYSNRGLHETRGFSSYHVGGCHAALADGSTRFISENIDLAAFRSLGIRDDGLPNGGIQE